MNNIELILHQLEYQYNHIYTIQTVAQLYTPLLCNTIMMWHKYSINGGAL